MSEDKTPWQKWKELFAEESEELLKKDVRPWDLFNSNSPRASEEQANFRYSICNSCPQFVNLTKQCKQCGCFMVAKTKLDLAKCPLNKW